MARKTPSRLELRKQAEAAEAEEAKGTKKKKTTKKKATRKKAKKRTKLKPIEKKRLVWVIFTGSMKEEARFPYKQQKEAEAKLETLRAKKKRLYFMQPVKEAFTEMPVEEDVEEEAVAE